MSDKPNPLLMLPDMANLTDRQMLLLFALEVISLKAEVRSLTNLILGLRESLGKPVTHEVLDKSLDMAQDAAISEMIEHAKLVQKPSQRLGTN